MSETKETSLVEKEIHPLSFSNHPPRQSAVTGEFVSLASEIAAMMNRQAQELKRNDAAHTEKLKNTQKATARTVQLIFHLEQALAESEEKLVDAGLGKLFKRFRIIKDQLKDQLTSQGFSWRNPEGEKFSVELADILEVDGWRYSGDYEDEVVVTTREPIVLLANEVILTGAAVIGAPE